MTPELQRAQILREAQDLLAELHRFADLARTQEHQRRHPVRVRTAADADALALALVLHALREGGARRPELVLELAAASMCRPAEEGPCTSEP